MGLTVRPKKGGLGTCSLSWGRLEATELEVREVKGCADGVVSKNVTHWEGGDWTLQRRMQRSQKESNTSPRPGGNTRQLWLAFLIRDGKLLDSQGLVSGGQPLNGTYPICCTSVSVNNCSP